MIDKLKITPRSHDDVTTFVDLEGDFDIYNTVQLKKKISELVDEGYRNIICNLAQVSYVDSSGIGALMVCLSLLKKKNGRFILMSAYESVKKVLEITKMHTFFEIYDNEEQALASIYGNS